MLVVVVMVLKAQIERDETLMVEVVMVFRMMPGCRGIMRYMMGGSDNRRCHCCIQISLSRMIVRMRWMVISCGCVFLRSRASRQKMW